MKDHARSPAEMSPSMQLHCINCAYYIDDHLPRAPFTTVCAATGDMVKSFIINLKSLLIDKITLHNTVLSIVKVL
jgi:hypothetical protein